MGNLPAGSGLTDVQMSHFFTLTAQSLGVVTPQPILSSWLSNDGNFGFVEFRAVQDTTRVTTQLEQTGLAMGGRQLRIGRPAESGNSRPHTHTHTHAINGVLLLPSSRLSGADACSCPLCCLLLFSYHPPPPALLNFVVGIPLGVILPDVPATNPTFNANSTAPSTSTNQLHPTVPSLLTSSLDVTSQAALPSQVTQLLSSLAPPPPPPPPASPPSRVVLLLNLLSEDDLKGDDEDDYQDLVADIRDEVIKYGAIDRCVVPRGEKDGTDAQAMGRVFIQYTTLEAAETARGALQGRIFSGRQIEAHYYPETALNEGQLTQ